VAAVSAVASYDWPRTRLGGVGASAPYTLSFQAPGFYERHGYRVLGTVPCLPPGTGRVFLTKPLK